MILARVLGSVTSTMKHEHYVGKKLLVVKAEGPDGNRRGKSFVAVDGLQAGAGDLVLVFDEGGSARQMLGESDLVTIRTVIGGIVDRVNEERER